MLSGLAKLILRINGWTVIGSPPSAPKAVFVAAPHTSNWDAFWAIVYLVATRQRIRLFAKHTLFWFPLGSLLSAFGCVPLDRSKARTVVRQAIDMFSSQDSFYLGLAPEGTRSLARGWKSGFYRIAHGAAVPVILATIDYREKRIGIITSIDLSGDMNADMELIAEAYTGVTGCVPEKTSPIQIRKSSKKGGVRNSVSIH